MKRFNMLCAFIASAVVGPVFGALAISAYLSGADRDGIIYSIHMDTVAFIWPVAAYIVGDWGSQLENLSVYMCAAAINIFIFMIIYILIESFIMSYFVYIIYIAFVVAVFFHGYFIGEFTNSTRSPYSWITPLLVFSIPFFSIVKRRKMH